MSTLLDRIKQFEGYYEKPYWDHKQWSVGYGSRASGPNDVVDQAEADRRLAAEIEPAAAIVDRFAPDLPPGVRDSLISLTYNAGSDWTKAGLGEAIKAGDWGTARDRFLQYTKASGEVLPGLVDRRQKELSWWDTPGTPTAAPGGPPVASAASTAASPATAASEAPSGLLGDVLAGLSDEPGQQPTAKPNAVEMPDIPELSISYPKLRRVAMPKQALARAALMRGRVT